VRVSARVHVGLSKACRHTARSDRQTEGSDRSFYDGHTASGAPPRSHPAPFGTKLETRYWDKDNRVCRLISAETAAAAAVAISDKR